MTLKSLNRFLNWFNRCNCSPLNCLDCKCVFDCHNCQCNHDCTGFKIVDSHENVIYLTPNDFEMLGEQGKTLQDIANQTGKRVVLIQKGWRK